MEGFKQSPRYQGGGFPVAEQLNLPEHYQVHDMRVSVEEGTAVRQREERRVIFQLGTQDPRGLNIDFKFIEFVFKIETRCARSICQVYQRHRKRVREHS